MVFYSDQETPFGNLTIKALDENKISVKEEVVNENGEYTMSLPKGTYELNVYFESVSVGSLVVVLNSGEIKGDQNVITNRMYKKM